MTAKKRDKVFVQNKDRAKLDVRISPELDDRISVCALTLGTSKNSIMAIGAALFCSKIEGIKGKKVEADIEHAMRELAH